MSKEIELYDTTLRDGAQTEGISFSVEDKLRIVQELDDIGIDYIEGGYAGANPKEDEFFRRVRELELKNTKIVAFGSTKRANTKPSEDQNLRNLLEAGTEFVTVVGKSWGLHVDVVLRTTLTKNLEMIEDSIGFLRQSNRRVIFDAEHFFDGYRTNPKYAIETLKVAENAGAECIVLCDTTGGAMPLEVMEVVKVVRDLVGVRLGIHAHDDSGVAVANTLLAVQAGVEHVHGTFNGYGERCGNANLCVIIPNLKLKLGKDCISDQNMVKLTSLSRLISELANLPHDERMPYVGKSAFAHKAGLHTDAVQKDPKTYEHVPPELIGNKRRFLISDQAGKSTIVAKLRDSYPELSKDSKEVREIYDKINLAEKEGYQFEAAEGSFTLLVNRMLGKHKGFFNLMGFTVLVERDEMHRMRSQATIKLMDTNGNIEYQASEGHGPVDALNKALRKALMAFYPEINSIKLTDFKVRVLDASSGTAAKVRVLIETSDGHESWGTVGVSEDIIEASWEALVDSIEYKLFKDRNYQK